MARAWRAMADGEMPAICTSAAWQERWNEPRRPPPRCPEVTTTGLPKWTEICVSTSRRSSGKHPIRTDFVCVRIVPAVPVTASAGSFSGRAASGTACVDAPDAGSCTAVVSEAKGKGTVWFSLAKAPDGRSDEARQATAIAAAPGRHRECVMMFRVVERPRCRNQGRNTRRGRLPERMVALVRRLIQPAGHFGCGQSESRDQEASSIGATGMRQVCQNKGKSHRAPFSCWIACVDRCASACPCA